MLTRSFAGAKPWEWMSLPAEIRNLILAAIAQQKQPGWASLASVSREWQQVLEMPNFRKLHLSSRCLYDIEEAISPERKSMIRHICLTVELPRYKSTCCSRQSSPSTKISAAVSAAIYGLLRVLSRWEFGNDLTLELNVYSPSDSEHWFRNAYLSTDHVDSDSGQDTSRPDLHNDVQHGWVRGKQVRAPPKAAVERLFRNIVLAFKETLPEVTVIKELIIRRQLRRCLSPVGLGELLQAFTSLERFDFEPWAPYDLQGREFRDRALTYTIRSLPETLRTLIIFEDAYKFYDRFPKPPVPVFWYYLLEPNKGLAAVLAAQTLKLQHVSISFLVDARDLFHHCNRSWIWPRLQSLALTSELLDGDWEKRYQLMSLLHRASKCVRNMPRIQTFVLWNGGKSHASAFIYSVDRDGRKASITCRSTWGQALSSRVVESWKRTTFKMGIRQLQVVHELFQGHIRSHGDAIEQLGLPCQVVQPASLWQIKREAYNEGE